MTDFWERFSSDWPALTAAELIPLVLAFLSFLLAIVPIVQSWKAARRCQRTAADELADLLVARSSRSGLMTVPSIRALARAVAADHAAPALTDAVIAEQLRRSALEIERNLRLSRRQLEARLRTIDELLAAFDPKGPPIMTIAFYSRTNAYLIGVLGLLTLALAAAGIVARSLEGTLAVGLLWAIVVAINLLAVLARRATRVWDSSGSFTRFDVLARAATTPRRWLHVLLAFWEDLVILALPFTILPFALFGVDFRTLLQRLTPGSAALVFALASLLVMTGFASLHRHRFIQSLRLERKWNRAYKAARLSELGIAEPEGGPPGERAADEELGTIDDQYWIITGRRLGN